MGLKQTVANTRPELEQFINAVFHDIEGGIPFFSSRSGNSKSGFKYCTFEQLLHKSTHNTFYYCTSSVKPPEDPLEDIRRKMQYLNAFHVIVLDDVGTKAVANGIMPSYIIESSEGNYQWGYILQHAIYDIDEANRIMHSIANSDKKLCDKACNSANRMVRLPCGINGKGENDFKVRLIHLDATLRFDPYELLVEWGVALEPATTMRGRNGVQTIRALRDGISSDDALARDDLYQWLLDAGRVHSNVNTSGFVAVDCPRSVEHSSESPAYYSPIGVGDNPGRRFFKCFHEHKGNPPTTLEFLAHCTMDGGPHVGLDGPSDVCEPTKIIEYDEKGVPIKTLQNLTLMLESLGHDLAYDELWERPVIDGRPFADIDASRLVMELGNTYGCHVATTRVFEAAMAVCHNNAFNRCVDFLNACRDAPFIGDIVNDAFVERVFIHYLNCDDTTLNRLMTRKWLLGCVYRALEPGYKFDTALLLLGREGIGKSTIFKLLAGGAEGPFFGELSTVREKEAMESLMGVWICEFSEMNIASRHSQAELKQFLSRTVDRMRPAYGRLVREFPRRVAFCGTSNHTDVLEDVGGGNRRFWPMECHRGALNAFDFAAFARLVPNIWRVVLGWYDSGETPTLDTGGLQGARESQLKHTREDDWVGLIAEWLEKVSDESKLGREAVRSIGRMHIAVECLGLEPDKVNRIVSTRITKVMDQMDGWEYNGSTPIYDKGYGRVRGWKKIN